MSYGLGLCGACRKPRIVDRSFETTTCPYCGCTERTGKLQFFFTSDSQSEVREALSKATGAEEIDLLVTDRADQRRRIGSADPHSSLVYRYEHASDIEEKMEILSEGLTGLKGEFTLEDVKEVAGTKAERMLAAMLDRGLCYETRNGFYRA